MLPVWKVCDKTSTEECGGFLTYLPNALHSYSEIVCYPQIYKPRRSQTSYTAPCNGVISHGTQIGDLWFFADHIRKNKHNTNVPTISSRCAVFYACLSSHWEPSRCRWHAHLTNHGYFDYWKNPKTPNLCPIPGWKWHRFWNLPCRSVVLYHQKNVFGISTFKTSFLSCKVLYHVCIASTKYHLRV